MDIDVSTNFRQLIHVLADGLTAENVMMLRYLCKDAIPHGMEIPTALGFFEYFETKGWINANDMSFLAEVLYRINRHDLLKRLPGVKNRRDYEENFLISQSTQNFTPYRIACFKLLDELTRSDFQVFRNACRDKLSSRNYQKSEDITTLLVCLEEEDLISDGDLEFILSCLHRLDNQVPYQTFYRLSQGDTTITLPKRHQSLSQFPSSSQRRPDHYFRHSQSLPFFPPQDYRQAQPFHQTPNAYNLSTPSSKGTQSYYVADQQNQYASKTFDNEPFQSGRTFSETDASAAKSLPLQLTGNRSPVMTREVSTRPRIRESEQHSVNPSGDAQFGKLTVSMPPIDESTCATSHCSSSETAIKNPAVSASISSVENDCTGLRREVRILENVDPGISSKEIPDYPPDDSFFNEVPSPETNNGQESMHERRLEETYALSPTSQNVNTPLEQYKMNSIPRGKCLIINNFLFEGVVNQAEAMRRLRLAETNYPVPNVGLKNREGSQKDAKDLFELFTSFGFEVELQENLDSRAIFNKVAEYSTMDHSKFDCFVVVIMSHGLQGCVYGVDGMKVRLSQIQKKFKPEKCPSLVDKPKLFFFQACQGDRRMDGHSSETSTFVASSDDIVSDSPEVTFISTPSEADFLIGHSTVPGYLSYRSRTSGSWYISTLVQSLNMYHETEDLLSILVKVNNDMAMKPYNQMSMPITTLRKKVFFQKVAVQGVPSSAVVEEC